MQPERRVQLIKKSTFKKPYPPTGMDLFTGHKPLSCHTGGGNTLVRLPKNVDQHDNQPQSCYSVTSIQKCVNALIRMWHLLDCSRIRKMTWQRICWVNKRAFKTYHFRRRAGTVIYWEDSTDSYLKKVCLFSGSRESVCSGHNQVQGTWIP